MTTIKIYCNKPTKTVTTGFKQGTLLKYYAWNWDYCKASSLKEATHIQVKNKNGKNVILTKNRFSY